MSESSITAKQDRVGPQGRTSAALLTSRGCSKRCSIGATKRAPESRKPEATQRKLDRRRPEVDTETQREYVELESIEEAGLQTEDRCLELQARERPGQPEPKPTRASVVLPDDERMPIERNSSPAKDPAAVGIRVGTGPEAIDMGLRILIAPTKHVHNSSGGAATPLPQDDGLVQLPG